MENLTNTEAEFKKSGAYKKRVYSGRTSSLERKSNENFALFLYFYILMLLLGYLDGFSI